MSTNHHPLPPIEGEMRLPLPGLYPVLSWQMNLTLHRATGLAKFVSIVREPSDHVEISRRFVELDPWGDVHLAARDVCLQTIVDMGHLMGKPTKVYEP